jgi:hypothetical protein
LTGADPDLVAEGQEHAVCHELTERHRIKGI